MSWKNRYFNRHRTVSVLLICMSMLLQQSSLLFGINASIADLFCIVIILYLTITANLKIPFVPLMFCLTVMSVGFFTAAFVAPSEFAYIPSAHGIFVGEVKLAVIFAYFVVGYSIAKLNMSELSIKWYSISGFTIGLIGIVFTLFHFRVFAGQFYFAGIRFRGLMIDPNYFSVLEVTSVAYLTRTTKIRPLSKAVLWLAISVMVGISASKTGFITLGVYLAFRVVEYLFKAKITLQRIVFIIAIIVIAIVTSPLYSKAFNAFSTLAPSFSRVQLLVTNFSAAMSQGGSDRSVAWGNAINLIKSDPFFGVGPGNYSNIALITFDRATIAHNTYLELASEWGLPMTLALFVFIFWILGRITLYGNTLSSNRIVLRDILLILLIGSLAISLNNARMFWFFLGEIMSLGLLSTKQNSTKLVGRNLHGLAH